MGFGAMGMSFAYGPAGDEGEMIKVLHEALDHGITFFDTAELYGPFTNEILVGKKALKGRRNDIVPETKFGIDISPEGKQVQDARPERIRRAIEGSLKRLQTDRIDIYCLHRVDPRVPVEEVALVMKDLMKEGKILHWGLSEAARRRSRGLRPSSPSPRSKANTR